MYKSRPLFQQYYCYNTDCPIRTKEKPWPHGEAMLVGHKGAVKCPHCKRKMMRVATGIYEN